MLIKFSTQHIPICMILMSNGADGNNNNDTAIWTTWEELLLAFAVKRHGLDDWATVAMELQNRHRSSSVFTPESCRDKYKNLRRRFENHKNAAARGGGSDSDNDRDRVDGDNGFGESFAWLEELRKLRVAELKQEVQRYDLSIESLQMKAKTLEEERKSSNENSGNGSVNIPDLDDKQLKEERSENEKTTGQVGVTTGKTLTVSCEDENRSCHESNSTGNRQAGLKAEPELERIKPDPESLNPVEDEEDSCDDSSDRHEIIGKESQEVMKDADDSAELRDSAAESNEGSQGTKESSDVQSSASLMTRKCRDGELDGGGGGANPSTTVGIKRERLCAVESEPLRCVLDNIWSQKHGSMFDHRLESQKTERYKKMIRKHVDLETVQSRIEDGSYSSCPAKIFVDLLLLVNNANVFFPKSSPESLAAHELRRLVMKELKNSSAAPQRPQTKPDPGKSDTLLAKHKSTTPLIVCKKRSSISGKASSSGNKGEEQGEDDKPSSIPKPRVKSPLSTTSNEEDEKREKREKPVTTGVRSMRRGSSSKGRGSVSSSQSGGPNAAVGGGAAIQKPISRSMPPLDNNIDKAEASKVVDKKKGAQVVAASSTVKKKGAADFLKRIKKNEPGKGISAESVKYSGDSSTSKVKMDNNKDHPIKKSDEKKDVRRSGGGNSGNKNVKEDISPSKRIGRPPKKGKEVVVTGKRGREGEGEGSSSKQPKKKSRR